MNRLNSRIMLRDLPLVENLPARAVDALETSATCFALSSGEYLYQQGDIADNLYIVIEGGIRLVETTREGQNVHLKIYSRGDIFGVLAISNPFPHHSGAQAIGDSMVAVISGRSMRQLVVTHGELALFVVDHLVAHMQVAHGRIRQMAAERVERRLARALVHYASKFGTTLDEVISIDVPLTQKDLADFIGTTPETVNRILKAWEGNGVLRCSRQHIDVLDLQTLGQSIDEGVYMGQLMS